MGLMGEMLSNISTKNKEIDVILAFIGVNKRASKDIGEPEIYELYGELEEKFKLQKQTNSEIALITNQIAALTENYAKSRGIDTDATREALKNYFDEL